MQEMMLARAKALLQSGDVQRVLGWQTGEFVYDVTPAVFETPEELDAKFVYNALIYVSKQEYYPLQIVLREILIQARQTEVAVTEGQIAEMIERNKYAELIKYGVIVVSSLPVMIMYPFAQKFFVKGVMLGAVKG